MRGLRACVAVVVVLGALLGLGPGIAQVASGASISGTVTDGADSGLSGVEGSTQSRRMATIP